MGFISWMTSDTKESISNFYSVRGALPVIMLDDKGNTWTEDKYEGYGVFNGKDYFELVAEMSGKKTRDEGISLYSENIDIPLPKFVSINYDLSAGAREAWSNLPISTYCEEQGFQYENETE